MRKLIFGAVALLGALAHAQTGNVGINTNAPTNTLDVNGTLRVRTLPPTESTKVVVADANGVLGIDNTKTDVSNSNTNNFEPVNESPAMFVIKRYKRGDWGGDGASQGVFITDFEVSRWQAFISGWGFINTASAKIEDFYRLNNSNGVQLIERNGKWAIHSDLSGTTENIRYDILFIKKGVVAADPTPEQLNSTPLPVGHS